LSKYDEKDDAGGDDCVLFFTKSIISILCFVLLNSLLCGILQKINYTSVSMCAFPLATCDFPLAKWTLQTELVNELTERTN
jgi:hypothetical protein